MIKFVEIGMKVVSLHRENHLNGSHVGDLIPIEIICRIAKYNFYAKHILGIFISIARSFHSNVIINSKRAFL